MPNNLTARKDGAWLVISMVPDVCKTPVGSAVVPIPYPIIAQCGSATKEVPHVRANSTPLITLASYIPTTTGDQPGVQKGIKSSTVGGTASFRGGQHSSTVNADKQRILRHGDMFWMNGKASGLAPNKPVQHNQETIDKMNEVAAPTAPSAAPTPKGVTFAKTLGEAAQKLQDAAPAVMAAKQAGKPLPASPYTQADKQAVINSGAPEQFAVRVIESDYAKDEGYIGKVREHGATISWMAPLSMVEHGDTDAEALLNAFGTRHNPKKNYSVLIIDTHKMSDVADVETIIPTNSNLQKLLAENPQISEVPPEITQQVLAEDFAPKYYVFAKGVSAEDINTKDKNKMRAFAESKGFADDETDLLLARHQLASEVAAWEEFTGKGMTLDTNVKNTTAYGPVELLMLDKSPKTLSELKQHNALLTVAAK